MKLTARSQTVVKQNYALITGDGFVNSVVPGWSNCVVNVVINEAMGADFCQQLVTLGPTSSLKGSTQVSEFFIYAIEGQAQLQVEDQSYALKAGSYVWLPPGTANYTIDSAAENTQLLTFQKVYEELEDISIPALYHGHADDIQQDIYLEDPQLLMQNLLPYELGFDMAVNIFTYLPGGNLPFVETHVMEHGLTYLSGQGIYRLDDDWYHVGKGDHIWMAPYCPQWFGALGDSPSAYIYYKNVNRFSIEQ
ncbi:MAG: (S)-ureidoglycine aminohydrolase [Bacteroidota bacterium]